MKIITEQKQVTELLNRGVENIFPTREFLEERLTSGEQLTLYTGYDPTAPSLHIGHGMTMMKLRQFQDLGHKIIMLIGDFTAMIGDPTDKTSARKQLTREEVLENCKEYQKQASAILNFSGDNPVEIKYNSEWLGKMNFNEVIDLASHFTVQRMMERDMFQKRLQEEKPIYVHEFMYPMMQGYDSVMMDVDGEIGGNDQTFNMLTGRNLMKELKNKEKFVMTIKLLADDSGKKMSKSEGNAIFLSDEPNDMFGKVMSWADDMIIPGYELCTRVDMGEIEEIKKQMSEGANPRDFKLRLAGEVVGVFLGPESAKEGREHFEKVIQNKALPDEIPELKPSASDIITVLVEAGICNSKSNARQMVEQGAVSVNGEKVMSIEQEVKTDDVVKKGSRFFVKIL